jgi:glycosyltransferase involved in cell wall biosynthesis
MIPLVSIIIPCYNQGQYLQETLQSILDQTYSNWECLIINDGSIDNTDEIAQKWLQKDSRFSYYYQENRGVSSARNLGLRFLKGEFVQFLDSDDVLAIDKIEIAINELAKKSVKEYGIVISNFELFRENQKDVLPPYCNFEERYFDYESILFIWNELFTIPMHCGFFDVKFFEDFKFNESLNAYEDWVMWVLFFKNNKTECIFIDKPLALYRINPNSVTMTKNMLPDYIKAYVYLKQFLSVEEYNRLSLILIERFSKSTNLFKCKFEDLKKTNVYKLGLLLKKASIKSGFRKELRILFVKLNHLYEDKFNKRKT